ncbi:protoheme IX farnesyltransferase [candidate division KSB1 bacterium]|nr:protoheme IX farnesyltransferase [candidate division KSB1 bacterium]
MNPWLKILLDLSKIRITVLVAMSAFVGYILATARFDSVGAFAVLGTLILSAGSAGLNQVQEWQLDKKMHRTSGRPIPAGLISLRTGLMISFIQIFLGSAVLWFGCNPLAMVLGIANIVWYNLVYTPLKRVTAFAVFPGALIGAIPPAIGWAAAGRSLAEPPILILGFFFFIWQVPHFWLLLLNLSRDYERAGFPTLASLFNDTQLARLTYVWTVATALISLMLPMYGVGNSFFIYTCLIFTTFWLIWVNRTLLHLSISEHVFKSAFLNINIYMLLVMASVSVQALVWN